MLPADPGAQDLGGVISPVGSVPAGRWSRRKRRRGAGIAFSAAVAADPCRKQVAQAHHTTDGTALHNREVAEPILEHDLGRLFDRGIGARRLRVRGHPVRHPGSPQILTRRGGAEHIPLGEDPGQEPALHHDGRAHVRLDHGRGRLGNRCVRGGQRHPGAHQVAQQRHGSRLAGSVTATHLVEFAVEMRGGLARPVPPTASATTNRPTRTNQAISSRRAARWSRRTRHWPDQA